MSLAFHLAHPERTIALVLFDTGPGYKKDGPREEWNKMARARAAQLEKDGLDTAQASAEVRVAHHRSARGLALAARGMLTQNDGRVIDSLLVLAGAEDKMFIASAEYMGTKIPGAEKLILANAGHAANIDQPAAFNAAVAEVPGSSDNRIVAVRSLHRSSLKIRGRSRRAHCTAGPLSARFGGSSHRPGRLGPGHFPEQIFVAAAGQE